jgi:transcriptional regulator with XRE-family HTH domain
MHYMNAREAAKRLGISVQWFSRLLNKGRLPAPDATYGLAREPLWAEDRLAFLQASSKARKSSDTPEVHDP